MSAREEIIEKTMILQDLEDKEQNPTKILEEHESEKRFFRKIKRKYRLMLAFLFFLSIILIFMILPMVIGAIAQGLW